MELFSRIDAAKFRAEGLNLMQAFRIDASLAKNDFHRTLVIAALSFVLVGGVSFIAIESVNAAGAAPGTPLPVPVAVVEKSKAPAIEPTVPVVKASLAAPPTPVVIEPVLVTIEVAPPDETLAEPEPQVVSVVPEPPDCFVELHQLSNDTIFFFDLGSAQLSNSDLDRLSQLGKMAADCPDAKIQISGHADTTGSDLINFDLSWKRADSTMNALAQLGLDTTQFEPVGFGARTPLSQGGSTDDDRNRRVEFVVLRDDARN